MPLSCLNGDKLINSFLLENEEWARLRLHYREMNLTMPCCKSAVVPKESKYGTPFFAHKARGGCTVNESPEHLLAKYTIACAIKETSWSVSTEVSGTNPDGEPWIADVLCDNGEKKVAFEVQLSPQNHDEYERRQQKYQESGIKCFWFKKKRKNGPTLHDDKELPIFLLDVSNPPSFLVNLNCRGSDKQIELGCFVKGVLNHDLKWRLSRPGKQKVEIETIHYCCWSCEKPIEIISGFYPVSGTRLIALDRLSDQQGMIQAVNILRQKNANITPVGMRYSHTVQGEYFAASCPHCDALQGSFFVMTEIRCVECGYTKEAFVYHDSPVPIEVSEKDMGTKEQYTEQTSHWSWQSKSYLERH